MKKTIITLFALSAALVACQKEKPAVEENNREVPQMTFTASFQQPAKTFLDESFNVCWAKGNTFTLYGDGNSTFTADSEGDYVNFTGDAIDPAAGGKYYALYAASDMNGSCTGGVFKCTTSGTQIIDRVGSFASGRNVAVAMASSEDQTLYFYNCNALLKISTPENLKNDKGEEVTISRIDFWPISSSDSFRGEYTITPSGEGAPEVQFTPNISNRNAGLQFFSGDDRTFRNDGSYYYVAPPATFSEGFRAKIQYSDGSAYSVPVFSEWTFERNKVYNLGTVRYGAGLMVLDVDKFVSMPTWLADAGSVSIVDNPAPTKGHAHSKVLCDDKSGTEGGTTGYFTINYDFGKGGPVATGVRKNFCGFRVKVYMECPTYFQMNVGGSVKVYPSTVNGVTVAKAGSTDDERATAFKSAFKTNEWNVLEFDLNDTDFSTKNMSGYQSIQLRPFCNKTAGSNSTGTGRKAYIDDIELIWK